MNKTEIKLPEKRNEFPVWGRALDDQMLVNFTSERRGTVWSKGINTDRRIIGHYSDSWISCFDTQVWEILPQGTVTSITLTI